MSHSNPETEVAISGAAAGSMPLQGQLHDPCNYFTDVYGNITNQSEAVHVLDALDGDPEYRDELACIVVENAIAEQHNWQNPNNGHALSQIAYDALGCASCILSGICPAKKELEATIETDKAVQMVDMFNRGSVWLKSARLHEIGMTEKQFTHIMSSENAWTAAIQDGFSIERLVGSVRNRQAQPLTRDELPEELREHLTSAKRAETFPTDILEFEGRDYVLKVADLTVSNGYKGVMPSEENFGVLICRFLNTMMEVDKNGNPQITNKSLQKPVRSFGGGFVTEFRMGGKSRLYAGVVKIAVVEATDASNNRTYQVLILGVHGDSEEAQEDFYRDTGIKDLPGN